MLPFLKVHKADGGVITQLRPTDEGKEKSKHSEDLSGLEAAMQELCEAEENKDYPGMARAFKAAFEMLEAAPHDEYAHED